MYLDHLIVDHNCLGYVGMTLGDKIFPRDSYFQRNYEKWLANDPFTNI